MRLKQARRLYHISRVVMQYGLDELLPQGLLPGHLRALRRLGPWRNQYPDAPLGKRLRLALEALGPVFVKLGQMLSTRRDLLPPAIADELALLQDQVPPFPGEQAKALIEQALGESVENLFTDFDLVPLASASIAQVHTARLKTDDAQSGQEVVLKVIRPDILKLIEADITLMFTVAEYIERWLPDGKRLRPVEVISEYEQTLLGELDLQREAANSIQLRRNFDGSHLLYVPEVYPELCRKELLVMERIYGVSVSDIDGLKAQGTDFKLLAERGVEVFFTQVFRDSFFHADMHPGNIFISHEHPEDPQWIAIDCGIVGTLSRDDKRYLADTLLAFFNRDYRRVAQLHIDFGWVPPETNVDAFETAFRTVCEPIFEKPLAEISFGHVLVNLFNTARQFQMQVQPQLVLLQKTLLYIEGLGRQLYPQLDLWQTAKPFLEEWMEEQIGPKALLRDFRENAPLWAERLPDLPGMLYENLRQSQRIYTMGQRALQEHQQQSKRYRQGSYLLGIGATLLLCAAILYGQGTAQLPGFLTAGGMLAWGMGWLKKT